MGDSGKPQGGGTCFRQVEVMAVIRAQKSPLWVLTEQTPDLGKRKTNQGVKRKRVVREQAAL